MHSRILGSAALLLGLLLSTVTGGLGTGAPAAAVPPRDGAASLGTGCPRLGVYSGWDQDNDLRARRWFGALPQVASTYLGGKQRINLEAESARILRGTSPNITITTKRSNLIAVIARGPGHPDWLRAKSWLDRYLDDLSVLADVDPSVPVYATIEHEWRAKVRAGYVKGPSARPKVYGRALNRFYRLAEAKNPRLRTTYWIVGYARAIEGRVARQFRTRPDVIVFDQYSYRAGDSLIEAARSDVRWIRRQGWYHGQEIGIGEFGMAVSFGDRTLGRFYTRVRHQLKDLRIDWAVFFNSENNYDTRIIRRTDRRRYPRAVEAFGNSLSRVHRC